MQLTPVMEKFILHWGEMGTRWGVNRSVAQIHALLLMSSKPLNAEEICEILSLARSNVSNSIKELSGWGLVKTVHVLGDRRDHFTTLKDAQETFNIIIEERKKREIDPTLAMLKELSLELDADKNADKDVKERINNMLSFIEMMTSWYDKMKKLPNSTLVHLVKAGTTIVKLIGKG